MKKITILALATSLVALPLLTQTTHASHPKTKHHQITHSINNDHDSHHKPIPQQHCPLKQNQMFVDEKHDWMNHPPLQIRQQLCHNEDSENCPNQGKHHHYRNNR